LAEGKTTAGGDEAGPAGSGLVCVHPGRCLSDGATPDNSLTNPDKVLRGRDDIAGAFGQDEHDSSTRIHPTMTSLVFHSPRSRAVIASFTLFALASLLGGCAVFQRPDPVWICGTSLIDIEETPPAPTPTASSEPPDEEIVELACGFSCELLSEPIQPRKRAEAMVMW
jgi:hypothetical protein